jgi:hypothetical protein
METMCFCTHTSPPTKLNNDQQKKTRPFFEGNLNIKNRAHCGKKAIGVALVAIFIAWLK